MQKSMIYHPTVNIGATKRMYFDKHKLLVLVS